jgi:hypothetical protein
MEVRIREPHPKCSVCGCVIYERFQTMSGAKGIRCRNCKHEKMEEKLPEPEEIKHRAYESSAPKDYEEF